MDKPLIYVEVTEFFDDRHSKHTFSMDEYTVSMNDIGSIHCELSYFSKIMLALCGGLCVPDGCMLVARVGNWDPQSGPSAMWGVVLRSMVSGNAIWDIMLSQDCRIISRPPWADRYGVLTEDAFVAKVRAYECCDPSLIDNIEHDFHEAREMEKRRMQQSVFKYFYIKAKRILSSWFHNAIVWSETK